MIIADQLCKTFNDFTAVCGVSFTVEPGQVLVILGPNGAGKTTTVRMLTSILRPSAGRASIAGFDVVTQADQVRSRVGVLTEGHGLYGRMNADEYLIFFGALYGLPARESLARGMRLLDSFQMGDVRRKRLSEFSKGMRQKLALVRSMLHEPPVLLLDEPTSAMDPESARMVRDAIHGLRSSERAIVLCTHNLAEAEQLADQVAIIRAGRIILQGEPAQLKRDLMGMPEYVANLSAPVNGWTPRLPEGVELVEKAGQRLTFRLPHPERDNPALLRALLDDQLQVVSFYEQPRSLEQVYLKAINATGQEELDA